MTARHCRVGLRLLGAAEIVDYLRVRGIDAKERVIIGNRFLEALQPLQDPSPAFQRIRVARIERQRTGIEGQRRCIISGIDVDQPGQVAREGVAMR